ncbi:eukaryotic translation initiation factor SUI1 [Penicillium angulare]|uniref:eukaryotic translation initiation factor SUI1 n=1 Tax=Penicillium angulare TaxID=116970 RepID=UPI002540C76D|nr:eukaryotic translation initiation factor SUI1 [Penicillium angulare]KAJ5288559.1 eukaryotic translation initiation factor SUI1 [Penicillium angulare]
MSIENLKTFDPFADVEEDSGRSNAKTENYIHIRIQQRNGRKTLTTVQGLPAKYDQKKILKRMKGLYACNGNIVKDEEMGEVIQLQGDQRKDVHDFLTKRPPTKAEAESMTEKDKAKYGLGIKVATVKVCLPYTLSNGFID